MRVHSEQGMKIPERGLIDLPVWQGHISCHMRSFLCLPWNNAKLRAETEEKCLESTHTFLRSAILSLP